MKMSVFGADSISRRKSPRNLDETLPSNEDKRDLSPDVYDLQDELERILQEEEEAYKDEDNKNNGSECRYDKGTRRPRRKSASISNRQQGYEQSELKRRVKEKENAHNDDVIKKHQSGGRDDKCTLHSRRKGDSSSRRQQGHEPSELERKLQDEKHSHQTEGEDDNDTYHSIGKSRSRRKEGHELSEETNKTISRTKRSSNYDHILYDRNQALPLSAFEGHSGDVSCDKKERKQLSLSLPSSVIRSEIGKTNGEEKRVLRRSSDSIQDIIKSKENNACNKERERTLTLETKEKRERNRERRKIKGENYSKNAHLGKTWQPSTKLSHDHVGKSLGEASVDTAAQRKDVGMQLIRDTIQSKTMKEYKTHEEYKFVEAEKMSNTTSRLKTFHNSHTSPPMLPSQTVSKERNCEKVAYDNIVASEAYVPECSGCKTHAPASSYCLNCERYLCINCLQSHDELPKLHRVLRGNKMPGSFTIKQMIEKCTKHPNEIITGFCEEHNCLCCAECSKGDHAKCTKQRLENMLIQIPGNLKLRQNISKTCKEKLTSLRKLHELKTSEADVTKNAIDEIKKKSLIMIEHIQKLERDSIKHVKEYFSERKFNKDNKITECEQKIELMCENICYLDEPKGKKESAIRTVERLKQIEMQCLPIQKYDTEEITSVNTCKFVINESLYKTVTEATSLGKLSDEVPADWTKTKSQMEQSLLCDADETTDGSKLEDTENSSCNYEENTDDLLERKSLCELQRISIWSEGDLRSHTCCTAVMALEDGTILVTDQKNRKLKWFDSKFSIKRAFTLSSEPWGISRISSDKYLVTLPGESSYQEFDIFEGDLTLGRSVILDIECTCAVQLNDQLLFAGIDYDKPKFILTKLDGSKTEFILTEKKFDLFRRPNHLLKSLLNPNLIFISDVDKGVFGIDMVQRKVIFHYTNQSLMCAMGMATTKSGLLYICSQQANSLHCISHEGQFLYSVSLQDAMTLITPQCLCYIQDRDEFLIVHDNSYSIFRFKLK